MSGGKLVWIFLLQAALFQGRGCLNSTRDSTEDSFPRDDATIPRTNLWISQAARKNASINSTAETENSEPLEISRGSPKDTQPVPVNFSATNCPNSSCSQETTWDPTNYTTVAEAVGSSQDFPSFRLPNSAAVGAGVFAISAVVGYLSCVGYRRFLQRKYGNGQILIREEVYDTTGLRNFEI